MENFLFIVLIIYSSPIFIQVSRLVILHEEAEDGNAMPDLSRPVQAVSHAVADLVKVRSPYNMSSIKGSVKNDFLFISIFHISLGWSRNNQQQ